MHHATASLLLLWVVVRAVAHLKVAKLFDELRVLLGALTNALLELFVLLVELILKERK